MRPFTSILPIRFAAVRNFHHEHNEHRIVNFVYDPVVAHAHAVGILSSRQFHDPVWTWLKPLRRHSQRKPLADIVRRLA